MQLNIQEILNHLPHRYPFLLVDRVLDSTPGKSLTAIKNVTSNEPFFTGHFPQRMVMPGVLMIEALAQACGILAVQTVLHENHGVDPETSLHLLASIDNVRFKRMVEPGDQLRLEVDLIRYRQDIWKFIGRASVDGELACSAELTSARRNV
jgi:3-hydroxyacyl-[acyl-carrier-protein] dehydratase